jgi:mandelamide amidase
MCACQEDVMVAPLHRRALLKQTAVLTAAIGLVGPAGSGRAQTKTPYTELSAAAAARALHAGDITAEAYAEALLARAQTCRNLRAFIIQDPEALLVIARAADQRRASGAPVGPLHGLPIAFKDNIDTVVMPTSGGTVALKDNVPPRTAPVAQRLFDAGALVAGKTNLHELAFGITNNNVTFGAVRNPYNPEMIAGGSSGGTAAAIAARLTPAGLGTDTGGSVRIPAALCGIVGLRPTVGRYSTAGIVPISSTRDTAGPMGRTVEDVALLDGVITGAPLSLTPADLRGVRLGVPRAYFYAELDPHVVQAMDTALTMLTDLGAQLVEADIPQLADLNTQVSFPVALFEVMRELPRYLATSAPGITLEEVIAKVASPDVASVLKNQLGDKKVPESVYRAAIETHRPALQAAYQAYFRDYDVAAMVFPTTPLPARPLGHDETVRLNGKDVPTFLTYIRNTDPASNAGLPGLSVPIALTADGLPVGLEFDGPAGSDRFLLQLGYAFEKAVSSLPPPPRCT